MTCELRGPMVSFNKKYKKKRTLRKRTKKKRTSKKRKITKKRTKRTKKQTKKSINKIKKRVKKTNQIIQKGGVVMPCEGLTEGGVIAAWTRGATDLTGNNCKNLYYHPEDLLGWGRTGAWYVGNSWTKATFQGSEGTNSEPYHCPQCAYFNDWAERHPSPPSPARSQYLARAAAEERQWLSTGEAVEAVSVIDVVNNPLKYYPPTGVGPFVYNTRTRDSKERNKGEEGNMQVRKIKEIVANPAAALAAEKKELATKCWRLFQEAQEASSDDVSLEDEDTLWDKFRRVCPGGLLSSGS